MPDLKERFSVFDELDAPDLWEESRARTPGPAPGPSAARRSVTVIVALAVFAAAAIFAYQAFRSKPVAVPASRVTNGSLAFLGDDFTGWLVEPDGSNLREITRPDDVAYAVPVDWSPDGSTLAMYGYLKGHAGDYCILLADADGSNMRPLTADLFAGEGENNQGDPRWSPDGTLLAFTNDSNDAARRGIYVMTPAGTDVRKIADGGVPSWSPDGQYVVFGAGSGGSDIYSVAKDGTQLTNLTGTPQAYESTPIWSPDGQHIAYIGRVDGEDQVFVMNADGSNQHSVTDIRNDGIGGYSPVWSPDGTTLAFEVYLDNQYDLYTVRGDGTDLVHLTNDPGDEHAPRWAPEGTSIAFTRSLKPESVVVYGDFDIYSVSADGTDQIKVTDGAGVAQGALTWQPRFGASVAQPQSPSPQTGSLGLPQMPSGAMWFRTYANHQAGLAEATTPDGTVQEYPAAQPATGIAVSPQGDEVAFNQTIGVNQGALAILDVSSGEVRRIVSDLGGLNEPAWSSSGVEILFATGTGDIYTVRPDGSHLTLLKEKAGAVEVGWSPDDKEIAYSTSEGDVWVLTLSDHSTRQVWHRSLGFGSWPSWSPTEAVLAIQVVDPESQMREIHLVPTSENSSFQPVTLNLDSDVYEPSWTPDGEFLLVSARSPDAKDRDIYAIRLADTSLEPVVSTPEEDSVPRFIKA